MAVITISRQVAALGDEIAASLAEKLGYRFVNRKQIEKRIVELGFPAQKLPKYDERKPGFLASLTKDSDEYLNYLQYAVIEAASEGNCILIGRGTFIILDELPNLVSLRLISNDDVRVSRLQKEFDWNEKQAKNRIQESDTNRKGFHRSFFNLENEDPQNFQLTLNTARMSINDAVKVIECFVKQSVTPEKEASGKIKIDLMLKSQELVNQLLFDYKININFLAATVDPSPNENGEYVLHLHGVADSKATCDKAFEIAVKLMPALQVKSELTVVQGYKTYQ